MTNMNSFDFSLGLVAGIVVVMLMRAAKDLIKRNREIKLAEAARLAKRNETP